MDFAQGLSDPSAGYFSAAIMQGIVGRGVYSALTVPEQRAWRCKEFGSWGRAATLPRGARLSHLEVGVLQNWKPVGGPGEDRTPSPLGEVGSGGNPHRWGGIRWMQSRQALRDRDEIAYQVEFRGPNSRNGEKILGSSERAMQSAVLDDLLRQGRPNARQLFQLGCRRRIDVQ